MEFCSIFTNEEKANLWSVCYPEHQKDGEEMDIFSMLFDLWNNTEYLKTFFNDNKDLTNPFWNNLSPDQAIDKVLDEAYDFEKELYKIEISENADSGITLKDIFKPLHENIYSINFSNEQHRKGKPNYSDPIIRLYGIELADGTLIITGGALKLTESMEGKQYENEFRNLERVQAYLKQEGIDSKEGLFYK
jgi:hypothetical protein